MSLPFQQSNSNALTYLEKQAPVSFSAVTQYFEKYSLNHQEYDKLFQTIPYAPDPRDLATLHHLVLTYKRTSVLEFGSGFSSLVIAEALHQLSSSTDISKLKDLRRSNLFHLYTVDDQKNYLKLTKKRFPSHLLGQVSFLHSSTYASTFNHRFCTYYSKLPSVSPDLIYIDGPDQFCVNGNVDGWSPRSRDMMPMSADVLRIEYFLASNTHIIVDGRSANVNFIRDNLQRNWSYSYNPLIDQHVFVLEEPSFGRFTDLLLEFYDS